VGGFIVQSVKLPGGTKSKRPTKADKSFRVDAVYSMLVDGHSRSDVIQFCAENFDVGERCTDNYIADARERLNQDCQITREALLAEALAGYRSIRQQAERRGQLMVAKSCLDATLDIVGIKA
jgi:hypothetical protein